MRKELFIALIGGCFLTLAAILTAPHWSKYFFPNQYSEQENLSPPIKNNHKTLEKDTILNSNDEKKDTILIYAENISISKIQLTPRVFNMPSYLYFEVKNVGIANIKNMVITINLGQSKYEAFDISKQINSTIIKDSIDKSFVKIECPILKSNETIEFYALTSAPIFKNILFDASNLVYQKEYNYEDYISSTSKEEIAKRKANEDGDTFWIFLQIVAGCGIIIFSVYFTIIIIWRLNKYFGFDEEQPNSSESQITKPDKKDLQS